MALRALPLLAFLLAAGCLDPQEGMAPACRNPQPRGADCSYDISALVTVVRYEAYDAALGAEVAESLGYRVTLANERAVVAERGDGERFTLEAREGWSWFILSWPLPEAIGGLTSGEVQAEGVARCREAGSRMDAEVRALEERTGWAATSREPCRASGGVA